MKLWPHQEYALQAVAKAIDAGQQRLCVTSPTGGGKSLMVRKIIEWGYPTLVLTNRSMLMEQWGDGLGAHGIDYDLIAAGYGRSAYDNCTLAMIQTLHKRWTEGREYLPPADIVILDEAHNEKSHRSKEILDHYVKMGKTTICVTATPIGIGHLCDHLIQAGTTTDLFDCGALVKCRTYAPDEPDSRAFKSQAKGILQFEDSVKEVMLKRIIGRVLEHYPKYNPDQRPAILFAPGVEESIWFTQEFLNAGIPWSHIDGERIILNGETMAATKENRERLAEASFTGETRGVSNRFVLREGIDWPWLYHGILACTFGSICSYIQAGGRLLRNHDSLSEVVVQDHGGNYHRHGSLNQPRMWNLTDTDAKLREKRLEDLRGKKEPEPFACPKCGRVRLDGAVCPSCNFAYRAKRRIVIQTDGTLKEQYGDIYRPRKIDDSPDAHRKWKEVYYRCKRSKRTFRQAMGLFAKENKGKFPGPDFPLMPTHDGDWHRLVAAVPVTDLTR